MQSYGILLEMKMIPGWKKGKTNPGENLIFFFISCRDTKMWARDHIPSKSLPVFYSTEDAAIWALIQRWHSGLTFPSTFLHDAMIASKIWYKSLDKELALT